MWASPARYQATVGGRLRSLNWLQCSDSRTSGWIATGADDGTVGINIVESEPSKDKSVGRATDGRIYKSCFNLRGHTGEVRIVRFKPQGDRLATYDSWGCIKLWNNRANVFAQDCAVTITQIVRDMQWSACGNYIVLCGEEGIIQIISGTNGQRLYTSQVVSPHLYTTRVEFVCCAWNDSNTQIALGTTKGEIFAIDPNEEGQFIFTSVDREGVSVRSLQFFGGTQEITVTTRHGPKLVETQSVSVYLGNGEVVLFPTIISQYCACIQTNLIGGLAQWNSDKKALAVVGYRHDSPQVLAAKFLDRHGDTILSLDHALRLPQEPNMSLQSMCWGLCDSTVFLGCGDHLYSMSVQYSMPRLQDLCRQFLKTTLSSRQLTESHIPLPRREIDALNSCVPNLTPVPFSVTASDAVQRLFQPLENSKRLLCLLVHSIYDNGKDRYTLKYEYMGRHIPLLTADNFTKKGFKVSAMIRPAFSCDKSPRYTEIWASPPAEDEHSQTDTWKLLRQRILKHMRPLSQSVMDTAPAASAAMAATAKPQIPKEPVLAEIKGNTVTNRFRFSTGLFGSTTDLGDLDIYTHYVRCEPRKLTLTLNSSGVSPSQSICMISKRPEWNQTYGIFELDFGGRISKDSVKNYQFEYREQVVFQLGRSMNNNFTLDFQYPFSPVTALCTALCSIL